MPPPARAPTPRPAKCPRPEPSSSHLAYPPDGVIYLGVFDQWYPPHVNVTWEPGQVNGISKSGRTQATPGILRTSTSFLEIHSIGSLQARLGIPYYIYKSWRASRNQKESLDRVSFLVKVLEGRWPFMLSCFHACADI